MGNYNTKTYDMNNSALQSGKPRKSILNSKSRVLQQLGCNKITKRRSKDKPEMLKSLPCVDAMDTCEINRNRYSVGNCDNYQSIDSSMNQSFSPNHYEIIESSLGNRDNDKSINHYRLTNEVIEKDSTVTISALPDIPDDLPTIKRTNPRLSEISINSDDLMLSTDVNLDQADDDVSKDYNANEKDDPFISSTNDIDTEVPEDGRSQSCAEELERKDIVCFDSSRESSVSLQRKISQRANCRRPHSFSTPLRSDIKCKLQRSSNLSTVDSVDLAWTWMSASESANISQEISNVKLMLLKTRRLLLDDFNNDLVSNEHDTNVFSEPDTPIYCNDQNNQEPDVQLPKCWSDMDKEALIQELSDMSDRNYSLQCQLNDKNRVIELLQDNKRRFQRPFIRTEPITSRIARSSTFDSSIMMNPLTPTPDSSGYPNTFSGDGKIMKTNLKNIDSGLYQSSSSTDSYLYQN